MGALTDLLLKRRDSPPKPPVHSTLDIPLPPPQPLWALATEPDWASRGGGGQGGVERRSFGPRAPRNVYDDGRGTTFQQQARERAGTRTRTTSVDDLSGAVHRLDLSQRGGGGGPRTPLKEGGGGGGARSAPPPTATAARRREDVYPPFPPAYSYSPTPSPSHPRSSPPQPPPYHPSPASSPFSSPSTRPPLPPRPSHSLSASSPLRPLPPPSSSPMRMSQPQHYCLDTSTGQPVLTSQSSPFSAPPPPPIPPLPLPATYPPPPSPPRSPIRLRPDYSPTRSSLSNRGPLPPLPPRETRPHPPLRGGGGAPAPPFGLPISTKQAVAAPRAAGKGKSPATKTTPSRTRTPFRPSPSSSATYSPSLHSSTTTSSSSSAAASHALSTDGSTSSQDDDEDEDDFLPSPSTVFRFPPSSTAPGKRRVQKPRSVSAPVALSSKKEKASSPAKTRTPKNPKSGAGAGAAAIQIQCAGTTHGNHRCTRLVRLSVSPFSQALLSPASPGEELEGEGAVEGKWEEANHYCGQHAKKAVRDGICVVRSGGGGERRVRYEDWIPPHLPLQTQALLREYMAKPVSEKDGEGYIYIHELVPSSSISSPSTSPPTTSTSPQTTTLKLGRTLHPSLRLSQWRTSCPSREPIVRGIFPRPPSSPFSSAGASGQQQQQGVALRFAERGGRWHHRWERLCLIEIAGRASAWSSSSSSSSAEQKKEKEACVDCGKKHVECFEVPRAVFTGDWGTKEGGVEDWETWDVEEVVERWGRWCSDILG